jgi:hypothetical protein
MARLSLWRDGKHTADYRFLDRRISEMFTIGGTGILLHKYLGPVTTTGSEDATQPSYANQSEMNIQDLLFLENRDRVYDPDVYPMRGQYQVADNSFDLSQFGLFLQTGTLFMTFHLNDMMDLLGRKIMNGDVLELMHLIDYNPLDTTLPIALKRFYVCSDAQFGAEGFTPTWFPHIWRVKLNPLTDSQEYKGILNNITDQEDSPVGNILSNIQKYQDINSAVIQQAEVDVPKSGYDTSGIYIKSAKTPDQVQNTPEDKIHGYMTGDGLPPNTAASESIAAGITFPGSPPLGQYFLRLDYVPNRLFRFDGKRWVKIEDNVRTNLTPGAPDNRTQRSGYANNTDTYTNKSGETLPTLQGLSKALRPKAD